VAPILLFLVVFFWTPPHYWPLSIKFRDQYAAADVPMLPVVATDIEVTRNIVAYSWAMALVAIALGFFSNFIYVAVTLVASAWFLFEAHALHHDVVKGNSASVRAMRVFHGSITYLSLIFLSLGVASLF
jgi:protoheme IX farnesyltransferase